MKTLFIWIVCIACVSLSTAAWAVGPVTTTHTTEADFADAETDNVVVWSLGEVTLGREVETILEDRKDVDMVSALAIGPDGATYVGTAAAALVLRIDAAGQVTQLADLPGVLVSSLLVRDGRLLAATAGGEAGVYAIDPLAAEAKTAPEPLWSPAPPGSVWALAADDETVFAATDPNGELLAIDGDGKAEVIFTAKQKTLRSLAVGGDVKSRFLVVGTADEGLVYRLDRRGQKWTSRVLLDADEKEIVSLAVATDGSIYAAATNVTTAPPAPPAKADGGKPVTKPAPTRPPTAPASKPANRAESPDDPATPPAKADPNDPCETPAAAKTPAPAPASAPAKAKPVATATKNPATPPAAAPNGPKTKPAAPPAAKAPTRRPPSRKPPAAAKGNTIYRIDTDGLVTVVSKQPQTIYAMALKAKHAGESEKLLVVTEGGRVVEIDPATGAAGAVAALDAKKVTAVAAAHGRVVAGTTDATTVVRIGRNLAATGTLTSKPIDAKQIAQWGSVNMTADLPAGTSVTLAARTGNTAEAQDETWSDWSAEIPAGSPWAAPGAPAGRFAQYRLTLTRGDHGASPTVDAVQLVHQVGNLPPEVESVTVSRSDRPQKPGKNGGPQRYRIAKIKAADANHDKLRYAIHYRKRGGQVWIKLIDEYPKTSYTWDTRTVPDGVYELKVEATDAGANAPAAALSDARISRPVVVDNTPPVITELTVGPAGPQGKLKLTATIRDANRLGGCQYVIDSADTPIVLSAADGIFDETTETVTATIDEIEPGPHVITLEATDEFENAAYAAAAISVAE